MAVLGKYTEQLHPRGHGGKFIRGLPKLQTVKDRNRATSTLARFRHHVLDRAGASGYHRQHGLTDPHREAVSRYFSGGYRDVNAAMREGRDHPDIAAVAEAMRPLQHDLVVSRRVEAAAFGLDSPDGLKGLVGKKVTDAAFQAASLHDEQGKSGITMHIAVPKGVPAVVSEDGQILLDRDTELAIVDAAPNGRGGFDVHAVLLKKPVARGSREPASSGDASTGDLSHMTVAQLREEARTRGLTGHSRLRKSELLDLLAGKGDATSEVRPASKPANAPTPRTAKAAN